MKLAVLGGSFNPIHNGHLLLADAVCRQYGYDTIAFVPAFHSPFKESHTGCSAADRSAMVQCAVAGNPSFYCELCEMERGGLSYTIDTLRFLIKSRHLEDKIGLIIGDDLADTIHFWHEAEAILRSARVIIGRRLSSGAESEPLQTVYCTAAGISFLPVHNAVLPISSTYIRYAIAKKIAWRYLVPESVYNYIISRHLYEYND